MFRGFSPNDGDETPPGPENRCWNCGGHVTARFARVMGDNDNEVYVCPNCCGFRELSNGASGDPSSAGVGSISDR